MRTKKTSTEKFADKVSAISEKLLNENQGYLLLCYNESDKDTIQSFYMSKGKIANIVECLYTCMKKDPMLANMMLAASSAIAQNRLQQQAAMEAQEKTEETAKEE